MDIGMNENQGTMNITDKGDINVTIEKNGLSYIDVKNICLDLFKSNFMELKREALNTVEERIKSFADEYVNKLRDEKIVNLDELKKPDMQYMLYECQKSYARYGDEELLHKLLFLIVERTKQSEKDIIQLNLNEAISIIPKMTTTQINLITIVFLIRYSKMDGIKNKEEFIQNVKEYWVPFIVDGMIKNSECGYLEYLGCGNLLIGDNLEKVIRKGYKQIFSDVDNIKDYLVNEVPEMIQLFKMWDDSNLYIYNLNTVGLTIGWANMSIKLGKHFDLNSWI